VALMWAKDKATQAKEKALDPRVRRRNTLIAVGGGLVVAAGVIAYLAVYGLNLPF
jgi:3-dehydroquinate synthetase